MGEQLIIAVDVDDVCADLLTEWLRLYNEKWDDSLTREDITAWEVDKFVKPECGTKVYRILSQPGLYDGVKPYPEALKAIEELRELGRVIYVTSCAVDGMDEKFRWLRTHGFLKGGRDDVADFIACKDKWLVSADILIDDAVHNVDSFRGAAFLVGHHHNRTTPCRRERIVSLASAPARVAQLIADKAALEKACNQPISWPAYGVYLGGS